MSQYNEGIRTFTANGALGAHIRVKITSASTTTPPQVEVAGSGEQHIGTTEYAVADTGIVAVRLRGHGGTIRMIAAEALAVGATLYGAAAGKVKDTSAGSAIGYSLEEATADGDIIEVVEDAILSTTAATVSIADAGTFTSETTVEGALQELYQNAISVQGFIPVPLHILRETTTLNVGNIAANGGLLASDTTPVLAAINGATDGCQVVTWVASNNDQVTFQTPLPPDLDLTADIVVHFRFKSGGTTNAVGFTLASYFNEGDTAVADTSETNQTTTYAEKIATIAAADVGAGGQTLTIGLTPAAHTTDTMVLSAIWIEYKRKLVTT